MHHDTIAMMSDLTPEERARSMKSVAHVASEQRSGHTPESFALQTAAEMGRGMAGKEHNWSAALVRLERAENMRPSNASPLTTIDRVRHLTVDIEMQAYARAVAESRRGRWEMTPSSVMPLDKEMGQVWAGDMRTRMGTLSQESLEQLATGKGISNQRDAVLMGSVIAQVVDREKPGIDGMTAATLGIQRTRGVVDRLAGRSDREIATIAPGEERKRMMQIEDQAGIARGRGPADTVGPRVGLPSEWHMAIQGTDRHAGDFLEGGARLEQRIALEKATLGKLDDEKLASTFSEIMPKGSLPTNATDRDRWIDAALRNEQVLVAAGVASQITVVNAVMRDRGPLGPGREANMPTGPIHSSTFHNSQDVAKNLELVSDNMLRTRFNKVHGMDHMRIPQEPAERRSWVHQANMISIAAKLRPEMAAVHKVGAPALGARAPEREINMTRLRPAAAAAMTAAVTRDRI